MAVSAFQVHPLVAAAVNALHRASQIPTISNSRQVRQPDSWLLRRCWQALAAFGTPEATFAAAEITTSSEPLSFFRALPILAERAEGDVGLAVALAEKLRTLYFLAEMPCRGDQEIWAEQLLAVAYSAARMDDASFAFACLERMDQQPGIWRALFTRADIRDQLAQTIVYTGPHPLTLQILRNALRQNDEAGGHFLHTVATLAAQQMRQGRRVSANRRLVRACVDAFQNTAIVSIVSRRYAAITFGLAGLPQQILDQLAIIANVQEARRMSSSYSQRESEVVVRQVRRARANPDVDFQLYTLKEAVEALPLDTLSPEHRQLLADKVAELGAASDGWSAAAVAHPLVRLGASQQAAAINERIHPTDHSRSEAHRVLVQALLQQGDEAGAAHQAQMGVRWAQSLTEHNPERLTIWGIADAYLAQGRAEDALAVLKQRRAPGFSVQIRRLFGEKPNEERLREEALRMHASLLLPHGGESQAMLHLSHVRSWAPQILEGKALALFYMENVLEPLLSAENDRALWAFLPDLRRALGGIVGQEFPARVEEVSVKLARRLMMRQIDLAAAGITEAQDDPRLQEERAAVENFLILLWDQSVMQGIWQTVYAVGGTLPLVIVLAGSDVALEIARLAFAEGAAWRPGPEAKMELLDDRYLPIMV